MRIIKTVHINRAYNDDYSHNVSGYYGPDVGWIPMGRLMPVVTNHVPEQPVNRWKAYMTARARGEL